MDIICSKVKPTHRRVPQIVFRAGLAAAVLFFAAFSLASAATVREIDKKIKTNQKELDRLRGEIKTLETEKNKLKRDEDALIRNLKKLDAEIAESVKKQVRLNRQKHETELQIKRIEGNISLYSNETQKWERSVLESVATYYVEVAYPERLKTDPVADWAYQASISMMVSSMKGAESKKNVSVQKERELVNSKNLLVALQKQSEEEMKKQRAAQLEKNQLYKTTLGKRVIAEQQAQQMKETADSLESLVNKLIQKKERTLNAEREAELLKKSFHEKQKTLPWPVDGGTVVSQYGKHLHPELNIPVYNNGVRIRTQPNSPVRSVEKGSVIYAADFRSYGQTVIIDHGGDTFSIYGLLGSITVKEGEKIVEGKIIGASSPDPASQIYFELRVQGKTENPLLWLK